MECGHLRHPGSPAPLDTVEHVRQVTDNGVAGYLATTLPLLVEELARRLHEDDDPLPKRRSTLRKAGSAP
jgi:hypothetical protein